MMFLSGSSHASTSSSSSSILSLSILEKELQTFEKRTKTQASEGSVTSISSPLSHSSLFAALEDIDHFREQRRQDQELLTSLRQQDIIDPILMKFEQNRFTYDRFHELLDTFQDEHREKNFLNIEDFFWLKAQLPVAAANKYFTAKNFIFLGPNDDGHVHIRDFEQYMNRAIAIEEYTIQLMQYSLLPNTNTSIVSASEYISFEQLSVFIEQHCLPYIDIEHRIVKSFIEFYTVTTALKFAFYMDVHNRNMMAIRRLAHSDTMVELQSLISISRYLSSKSKGGGYSSGRVIGYDVYEDKRFLKDQMDQNWFSPTNVINIYTIFLQLDEDKNGLLNIEELKRFTGFFKDTLNLTTIACERIIQQTILYPTPCELDYRAFVQVILAFDNIHRCNDLNNPAMNTMIERGLRFFWNVIDFDHNGILSYVKIKYFYDEIKREMGAVYRTSLPSCDIVVGEIYDMLGYSQDQSHASDKQALDAVGPDWDFVKRSPQAKTVLLMLLDVDCFYRYEFRESLASSPEPQEDSPSEVHSNQHEPQNHSSNFNNDDEEEDEIKTMLNTTQRIKPSVDFKNLGGSLEDDDDYEDDDYNF